MRKAVTAVAQHDAMDTEGDAEDLGWKTEDETATRRKDKGKGKADDSQDGTEPGNSEDASVSHRYSACSLSSNELTVGTPHSFIERTLSSVTSRQATAIRGTGARDAEAAHGQRRITQIEWSGEG